VNCARGGLYNEDALYRGLKSGKIASLGIDVWVTEPQHAHPLYEFDNVVGTPHLGASTYEATARVGTEVVAEVIAGLKGEIVKNAVNIPSVSEQSFAKLKAWIELVDKMGSLYAQIRKESVKQVEIEFAGKEVDDKEDVKVLSLVGLKGLLDQSVPETVNFVNASLIAEQRGIDVRESISLETYDYSNLVKMKVTEGSGKTFEIHGTVFDKIYPRIVRIGDYKMELIPEGRMVWSPHKNVPGVIGRVGTTMAEYNVNILRMVVSDGPQDSMMILTVENNVPQEALEKVREFSTISDVKVIDL
jgi:D-3-phosphoglycerate dehydrogenase / 2-oxoglutarate reductase